MTLAGFLRDLGVLNIFEGIFSKKLLLKYITMNMVA